MQNLTKFCEWTSFSNKPSDAASVVQCNPCRAAECVPNAVLNGHVSAERRPVVDVGSFSERTVRAADVMVVATDDNRSLKDTRRVKTSCLLMNNSVVLCSHSALRASQLH